MFDKILIANRGEIACRVIKTARRLGIATVAVYSDADRDALHVQMADEATFIGAAPSSESYLVIDRIVQACLDTGAQAVHPGYGFLSENPTFAEMLERNGIAFVGPRAHAIMVMGDKITSKQLAEKAGVSTVPGYTDVIRDADHAVEIAAEIGYPVMLKASAGGGGKGMRVAYNEAECRDGFIRATNEARSSFGDERVFIEKFIEQPRHIEIQVLADSFGHTVYLGERECSIQRRHQKVIEEAPSPFLDETTRQAMGEQAVALAKAVDYRSAGTVEFIVDAQRNFYFLEMNTRLQVEHPVTEEVTGIDLVEQMLRIAANEPLPLRQEDIHLQGWAIEARVYAEDPLRGFLPSIGRVQRYQPPKESRSVRVDTGIFEGGEVSMYYDPMIAKLITVGSQREIAIERMNAALNAYVIEGVRHNISFLAALMRHPRFRSGQLSTNFIADEYPDGFAAAQVQRDALTPMIVVAAALHRRIMERAASIADQMPGHERKVGDEWTVLIDRQPYPVEVRAWDNDCCHVHLEGTDHRLCISWWPGQSLIEGTLDGAPLIMQVARDRLTYVLTQDGVCTEALVMTRRAAALQQLMPVKAPPDTSRFLLSPMPGLLVQLLVEHGDEVDAGQELAVIEAMKMENVLRAERKGVVREVLAHVGESLSVDQAILGFE